MCTVCVQHVCSPGFHPQQGREKRQRKNLTDRESSSQEAHLSDSTYREAEVQRGNGFFSFIAQLFGDKSGTYPLLTVLLPAVLGAQEQLKDRACAWHTQALGSSLSTRKNEKYKTSKLGLTVMVTLIPQ